jgi:hypothetical protein
MSAAERKTFDRPDETRSFERGSLDLVDVAGAQIGRLVLEPGWRWSDHVKPLARLVALAEREVAAGA